MTARELATALGGHRRGTQWMALCPAHEDVSPSLSIREGNDGRVLLNCFAGCSFEAILHAVETSGIYKSDLFAKGNRTKPFVVATYRYERDDGSLAYEIDRYADKCFKLRPAGTKERIPYRLPQMLDGVKRGDTIVLVEGEKDADALVALGFTATTAPFGANAKMPRGFYEWFRGAKCVVVIGDKDEPGRGLAHRHARNLRDCE